MPPDPTLFQPLHREVSGPERDRIPHRLGWKNEFFEGWVRITPAQTAVVTLCLDLAPQQEDADRAALVRPPQSEDEIPLIRLFQQAFKLSVEYAAYTHRSLRKEAAQSIHGFFARDRIGWPSASRVVEYEGKLIAAALIAAGHNNPLLQPLFVHPDYQHQGWGTTLMQSVVNRLLDIACVRLYSRCHLGNAPSLNWHTKFGFVELPDVWIAAHRARHYQFEADRHARLGDLSEAEMTRLRQEEEWWWDEWRRLLALEKEDYAAVHPMIREW
jgi:GNAT superfamily N-acetyltransferase